MHEEACDVEARQDFQQEAWSGRGIGGHGGVSHPRGLPILEHRHCRNLRRGRRHGLRRRRRRLVGVSLCLLATARAPLYGALGCWSWGGCLVDGVVVERQRGPVGASHGGCLPCANLLSSGPKERGDSKATAAVLLAPIC